jgi:hypothetical protein
MIIQKMTIGKLNLTSTISSSEDPDDIEIMFPQITNKNLTSCALIDSIDGEVVVF